LNPLKNWLHGFIPRPTTVNQRERLRAACGALLGIFLTGLVSHAFAGADALPFLVAPMGASAVLLFALPSSPLAQPWSIIGGNLVSATLGVICSKLIADPILAASLAVSTSIAAMLALRCLHPPSGAVALTAVLGGPLIHAQGFHFIWWPIGINSLLLLGVALAFNNLTRHRYPHGTVDQRAAELQSPARPGFNSADLDYVLSRYNEVLDVSRDDLELLLRQAEMHAYRRRFGEITCADIMSRDVVAVEYGTELHHAWKLLHQHQIKAMPVVDTVQRVIGIVTLSDFIRHADLHNYQGFDEKFRRFLRRVGRSHSEKPEVVGQIMTRQVQTVSEDLHITELVQLLTHNSHRHIPVINSERRLTGIVTNSDLVAGMYRGRLLEQLVPTV